MSQNEIEFLRKLRNTMWTVFGLLIFTVVITTIPFYFNTQNELKNSRDRLEELRNAKADRITYELTIKEIQKDISEINRKLDKKVDKQ
jgi:hypothetical protein